jgi:integrase
MFNNPAAELGKVKVRAKQLELPSREEFTALVSAVRSTGARCSQQCGDLVEFLAFSGCRLGEAGHVRWTDVDLKGGMMWVHGETHSRAQRIGSGDRGRSFPRCNVCFKSRKFRFQLILFLASRTRRRRLAPRLAATNPGSTGKFIRATCG